MAPLFLAPGCPEAAQVVEAIAQSLRARHTLPFLGAGVSCNAPSRLPLAKALSEPLQAAMLGAMSHYSPPVACETAIRAALIRLLAQARLERLFALLEQTHGRATVERYLAVLDSSDFNPNHAAVAALARAGLLPFCITLNFDTLIEHAVVKAGGACTVTCPLSNGDGYRFGDGPSLLTIVKPHGSLDPTAHGPARYRLLSATLRDVGQSQCEAV